MCVCVSVYVSVCQQTSRMGLQGSTEELMNTMPFLDTVAGEALSMLWGSNTTWRDPNPDDYFMNRFLNT